MNPVIHFELPADNLDRAKKFYQAIFGWELEDMPEMKYTIVRTTKLDPATQMPVSPGAINGGMSKRGQAINVPSFAIEVPDIDAFLKAVTAAGGKVVQSKTAVGTMGFMAYFKDSEDNVLSLWQNA